MPPFEGPEIPSEWISENMKRILTESVLFLCVHKKVMPHGKPQLGFQSSKVGVAMNPGFPWDRYYT